MATRSWESERFRSPRAPKQTIGSSSTGSWSKYQCLLSAFVSEDVRRSADRASLPFQSHSFQLVLQTPLPNDVDASLAFGQFFEDTLHVLRRRRARGEDLILRRRLLVRKGRAAEHLRPRRRWSGS